jgi:phosphohistidine swiveling domain-containing protein
VKCLLSGHNPRETFSDCPYPITIGYSIDFAARRQMDDFVSSLAGGIDELDLSIPPLIAVEGSLFINLNYYTRNMALVVPFDVESFGAPKGMVVSERKPRRMTQLLLPFRLWRVYRQALRTHRTIIPHYRKRLGEIYWSLRECSHVGLDLEHLLQIDFLFQPATLDKAFDFIKAYMIVMMLSIALAQLVNDREPALLNLVVGRGTSTALLGEHMWRLGKVAQRCGDGVGDLLRYGETNLGAYRQLPAAAPLLEGIEQLMRTYGHRAFRNASEFEATRLADQPDLVLLTIAGLMEKSDPPSVRAEAARRVSYQALGQMDSFRRFLWRRLLKIGNRLIEWREENRDTAELQNATYGLAARLLSRYHFPDYPDDYLWFYTFDEFIAFGQSHGEQQVDAAVIKQRRAEWQRNQRRPVLPELIWYDPETEEWSPALEEEPEPLVQEVGALLYGIGASAGSGVIEGVAVVADSPETAAQRMLDMRGPVVLVTVVTDPVWSSLFARLAAVVTEMGGVVSHAATVARENGIPAVVGVRGATQMIPEGVRVRVDATAGTVEILE